ncbi:matrix metalloproteinase-2-like [Uloborus diversus]|uniref:matrix metalloproteinase-2-like n=1 Tax=Uloborus diversus TaxID=327109 RepID=UPI0024091782|nr:matrix metalloproteinase-2-like [Uloborus diversus]
MRIAEPGLHRKARIATRIWTVAVAAIVLARASPVGSSGKQNGDLVKYWHPVETYLKQFGYLTPSSEGAQELRTEDKLREAIRSLQKFGGLNVTGIVDGPTLALLGKRRCGMPDLTPAERVRRYAIQGQRWENKDITWSIKRYPRGMDKGSVRVEISKAFKVWSDVSQLNFKEVNSGDSADIIVSFEHGQHGDGYPFDGRGIVLAHAFFPGMGIGGDAHFDAEEPWMDRQPEDGIDGVRLFAVAAHEFGHSLGLSHSADSGALMHPYYQIINDNFQLPRDDTLAIQIIYGPRNPIRFAPLTPNIPPTRKYPVPATHRPHRPVSSPGPPDQPGGPTHHHPSNKIPHTCNTTFDAVSVIRGELFIFKGKYLWRLNHQGLTKAYPVEISRLWNDTKLKVVDAVYERTDTKIVFFSGNQYWLFDTVTKVPGYPRPLTDLGLPPDLKRIDAAMVWGYNGKTYLFAGTKYWRYDESEGRVELDYPRDMSMWRGVPYHIDAAFRHTNGKTYFFKGKRFWEFNDNLMTVRKNKHGDINEHWFRCPSRTEQAPEHEESEEESSKYFASGTTKLCFTTNFILLWSFAVTFLFKWTRLCFYLT